MKRVFAALLALAAALSATACAGRDAGGVSESRAASSPPAYSSAQTESGASSHAAASSAAGSAPAAAKKAAKDIKIAVVLGAAPGEYRNCLASGCAASARETGCAASVFFPETADGQAAIIGEKAAAGFDALVCAPDGAGAVEAMRKASGKLAIVSIGTDTGIPGAAAVGPTDGAAAKLGGDYGVKAAWGKAAKAAILFGPETDGAAALRREGYEKACAAAGASIAAEVSSQDTLPAAVKAAGEILEANPRGVNLFLCHSDVMAVGAMDAVKVAGARGVRIMGFGGSRAAALLVASGDITATISRQPYVAGRLAVETAVKAVNGEKNEAAASAAVIDVSNAAKYLNDLAAWQK